MISNHFFTSLGCLFHLSLFPLMCGSFKFDVVPFVYFSCCCLSFRCPLQEIIAKSSIMKPFPYAFFLEFYSCRSSIQLWVNFSFPCRYPIFPASFIAKTVLSSLCALGTLVKDHLIDAWEFVSGLSVLFYCLYVFLYASLTLFCFLQLWNTLWNQEVSGLQFLSSFQDCFGNAGSLED